MVRGGMRKGSGFGVQGSVVSYQWTVISEQWSVNCSLGCHGDSQRRAGRPGFGERGDVSPPIRSPAMPAKSA